MIIYLLLLISIVLNFILIKNKKKALLLSFVFITIVAALRKYTVGIDTKSFYESFEFICKDNSWNYRNFRFELGFYYMCKILGLFSKNGQILIAVSSIFINFNIYRFIKNNSSNLLLSTLLYIIMLYFFSNMNIMRQALSLSILLYGFDYLKNKKYIKYIITIFIASLFHSVALASILLLIFTVIPKKKITYLLYILIIIITFVFSRQFFDIITINSNYSLYGFSQFASSNYFGAVLSALEIIIITIFLYLLSYRKENKEKTNEYEILVSANLLYIWFELLVIKMVIFNRLSGVFGIYNIIFIPYLLEFIKQKKKEDYYIAKNLCIIVYFTSFLLISIFRSEWYGVIPYYFFWE